MKKVLEDLYDGKLKPAEDIIPNSPLFVKTNSEIDLLIKELKDQFKENDNILERLIDCYYKVMSLNSKENFLYGFKLGAKFMAELESKDE